MLDDKSADDKIYMGGLRMKSYKTFAAVLALTVPLALVTTAASAEDQLKMVIGQINNWENQAPTLGQDAGIYKKHGLVLENVGTAGAGETIQTVISGSADLDGGDVRPDRHRLVGAALRSQGRERGQDSHHRARVRCSVDEGPDGAYHHRQRRRAQDQARRHHALCRCLS